jgi:hypothetical protein
MKHQKLLEVLLDKQTSTTAKDCCILHPDFTMENGNHNNEKIIPQLCSPLMSS